MTSISRSATGHIVLMLNHYGAMNSNWTVSDTSLAKPMRAPAFSTSARTRLRWPCAHAHSSACWSNCHGGHFGFGFRLCQIANQGIKHAILQTRFSDCMPQPSPPRHTGYSGASRQAPASINAIAASAWPPRTAMCRASTPICTCAHGHRYGQRAAKQSRAVDPEAHL
jgi:hypothetical protein